MYFSCNRTSVTSENRKRKRAARAAIACPMRLQKDLHLDGTVTVRRGSQAQEHNHTLDDLDEEEVSSVWKDVLRAEAAKGYLATELHNNLLRHHSKDLEVSGGKAIDYDYVYNFCRSYKDKFAAHCTDSRSQWDQQRYRAAEWLQTNGWYFQEIMAIRQSDKEMSFGLVFAHPERLKSLVKDGYLTVMDSMHNTNKLRWHLFSLIVRAECGNWIPAAHSLTAKLDSDIVASALQQVRLWCEGHGGWALKYMLTDDPASTFLQFGMRCYRDISPFAFTGTPRPYSDRPGNQRLWGAANWGLLTGPRTGRGADGPRLPLSMATGGRRWACSRCPGLVAGRAAA
ncbi:hypothetical protein VTN31DRAFT_6208 [Thermomyces dupontii]|uniref:uncharacterized protein n=1 Tax=Talaromyces thermophilus TaxID=28565 RepID=UPI0037431CEB